MCRYLQFGHNGDDLHSMTRRWQFTQTNATMLPLELHCFISGAAQLTFPSEPGNAKTLRSNSMLRSLGLSQVFFIVFLFSGRGSLSWRSMLLLWLTGSLLHVSCCFLRSNSFRDIDRGGPSESSVCSMASLIQIESELERIPCCMLSSSHVSCILVKLQCINSHGVMNCFQWVGIHEQALKEFNSAYEMRRKKKCEVDKMVEGRDARKANLLNDLRAMPGQINVVGCGFYELTSANNCN